MNPLDLMAILPVIVALVPCGAIWGDPAGRRAISAWEAPSPRIDTLTLIRLGEHPAERARNLAVGTGVCRP